MAQAAPVVAAQVRVILLLRTVPLELRIQAVVAVAVHSMEPQERGDLEL
jgi:hypothetical protein